MLAASARPAAYMRATAGIKDGAAARHMSVPNPYMVASPGASAYAVALPAASAYTVTSAARTVGGALCTAKGTHVLATIQNKIHEASDVGRHVQKIHASTRNAAGAVAHTLKHNTELEARKSVHNSKEAVDSLLRATQIHKLTTVDGAARVVMKPHEAVADSAGSIWHALHHAAAAVKLVDAPAPKH